MERLRYRDFLSEIRAVSGKDKKDLKNGIEHRIRANWTREEILDYIRETLAAKNLHSTSAQEISAPEIHSPPPESPAINFVWKRPSVWIISIIIISITIYLGIASFEVYEKNFFWTVLMECVPLFIMIFVPNRFGWKKSIVAISFAVLGLTAVWSLHMADVSKAKSSDYKTDTQYIFYKKIIDDGNTDIEKIPEDQASKRIKARLSLQLSLDKMQEIVDKFGGSKDPNVAITQSWIKLGARVLLFLAALLLSSALRLELWPEEKNK